MRLLARSKGAGPGTEEEEKFAQYYDVAMFERLTEMAGCLEGPRQIPVEGESGRNAENRGYPLGGIIR